MDGDVKKYASIGDSLKMLRQPYEAHFRELGDHFQPRRSRFYTRDKAHKSSEHVNRKIVNNTPRLAHRTMQSGIHAGITSPARPWFRLLAENPDHRKISAVKYHFAAAQNEMRQMLQASGLYSVLHTLWGDLSLFGHDCAIIEDDDVFGLHGMPLVPGEYWLGANSRGMVDTLHRETEMTVQQLVSKFVYRNDPTNPPDWTKVSKPVKDLFDRSMIGSLVPVCHLIQPRYNGQKGDVDSNKPVASIYWEPGRDDHMMMGDLGYDDNPILASRWDVEGNNVYGSSPAMDTLPDAKELQVKERDKAEARRRANRPPMNVAAEMRNSPFSMMPEALNFMADPSKGAVPTFQVRPDFAGMTEDIRDTEERVNEGMYANLFLMIANLDRRQITAREIDERHEEKLLGLGPVLERQHKEKLGPLIRRLYARGLAMGRIPPLEEQYDGMRAQVDYISTLAQAQKAVATGGIERLYAFVGNVSAVDGTVVDKLDNDKAVDEYADLVGVTSEIIRSDQAVEDIRKQRAEQMAAAQQQEAVAKSVETIGAGAQAAKVLSEADATGRPVDILRNIGLG